MRSTIRGLLDFPLFLWRFTAAWNRGDGGGGDPQAATTAEGLWVATTSDGRSIAGVVLGNREYWVIYTLVGISAVIAGAVQGNGSNQRSSLESSNGKDFNFEGAGVNDVVVAATFVQKQSLSGSIKYDGSSVQTTFTSTYDPDSGSLTGVSASGCTFTGSISTHANGNVYDISITSAVVCAPMARSL